MNHKGTKAQRHKGTEEEGKKYVINCRLSITDYRLPIPQSPFPIPQFPIAISHFYQHWLR
jgi:hypothetical protein